MQGHPYYATALVAFAVGLVYCWIVDHSALEGKTPGIVYLVYSGGVAVAVTLIALVGRTIAGVGP